LKTALHIAILADYEPVIEYLLSTGWNCHIKNKCGETPTDLDTSGFIERILEGIEN
jgi:hypothetical protein